MRGNQLYGSGLAVWCRKFRDSQLSRMSKYRIATERAPPIRTEAFEMDDDQERVTRLLLLGKGAVLAHRMAGLLPAESDESEQRRDESITRSRAVASSSSSSAS